MKCMMRRIDRDSPQKLYLQLAEIFEEQIATQSIPVGAQLPTEDELCEMYKVSKAVVRHAMEHLAQAGYIKKIAGKGTFVQRAALRRGVSMSICLDDPRLEEDPPLVTRVLAKAMSAVPPHVAPVFRPLVPAQVFKLTRLFSHRDLPVALETAFFSDQACPGLALIDFRRCVLPEIIERHCAVAIGRVAMTVDVALLSGTEAEHLRASPNQPATLLERIYYDLDERPLGVTRTLCKSGQRRLFFELLRLRA